MELVLLRHAQPAWNRDEQAQVDPELTALGREQARLAADRLAGESFDRVLVSTAVRAGQTAEPLLAARPDLRAERREWMHEIRMPASWQGTPSEEIGRVLREARVRPREQWWEGLPGGESFADFHARVARGLEQELAEIGVRATADRLWQVADDAPRLLMIAHAGTNSVVLGALLGLEPEPWEWERFASAHASLTVLRSVSIATGHIFSLQRFSDVGHLGEGQVTG